MQDLISWLQSTWLARFMAEWQWAWPVAEALHFIGMAMLFGSVLVMDLRLMGFLRRYMSIRAVHSLAPWATVGFVINLSTGVAFLAKDAARLLPNPSFIFKMVCVLIAGLNFLLFLVLIRKHANTWQDDEIPPLSAKLIGMTSLAAWTLVIWGGRMIPVFGVG